MGKGMDRSSSSFPPRLLRADVRLRRDGRRANKPHEDVGDPGREGEEVPDRCEEAREGESSFSSGMGKVSEVGGRRRMCLGGGEGIRVGLCGSAIG